MNFALFNRSTQICVCQCSSILLAALLGKCEYYNREKILFAQMSEEVHVEVFICSAMNCSGWSATTSTASASLHGPTSTTSSRRGPTLLSSLSRSSTASANPLYRRQSCRFSFFVLFTSQSFAGFFVSNKNSRFREREIGLNHKKLTLEIKSSFARPRSCTSHVLHTSSAQAEQASEVSI